MNDTGSLYDFAGADYQAPTQRTPHPKAVKEPPQKSETPHANREDLSKPYSGQFQQKANAAPVESAPKTSAETSAETSYWRWFTSQADNNVVAHVVNKKFNRSQLTDYRATKIQYIKQYDRELGR